MLIEVWSDVVCPWCYIGKRRLEGALAGFPHADQVQIVYRSFELDPTAPEVGHESIRAALARKYAVDDAQAKQMMDRVAELAAQVDLAFDYDHATHTKTVDAHRLLHLAKDHGLQADLKEALLAAYFTRGDSMGDHDVLRRVAVSVGLEKARVDEVLGSSEYLAAVRDDIAQARGYGATGVPFFVVDGRYGIAGAQPTEIFAQTLERAWSERPLQVVGVGGSCGPDGCPE